MQIKDKKAIVTGAAGGLGFAFTKELLRNGASVAVMIDIKEAEGKAAAEELNNEFGRNRAIFMHCDIAKSADLDAVFKEAVNTMGGLDILVNNAGIINEIDFMKCIDVDLSAVIRGTMLGLRQMGKDSGGKGGIVVNVSSMQGMKAPAFSATQHAVLGFTRAISQPYHYQKTGVRVIVICPGLTMTEFLDSFGKPENAPLLEPCNVLSSKYIIQRPEHVAHGLVYVIRSAQNGTVWVSENSEPIYEVQLPDTLPRKEEADSDKKCDTY